MKVFIQFGLVTCWLGARCSLEWARYLVNGRSI